MDGVTALERSFERLDALLISLGSDQLEIASPCEGWDLRAIVNHMLGASWMFTLANQGEYLSADAGDLAGDHPRRAAAQAAEVNVASWQMPGAREGDRSLPFGTFIADDALWFNVGEIAVHTWDLAKATDQDPTLDGDVVSNLFCFYLSMPMDTYRSYGAFGSIVPVPELSSVQDRMLAHIGRGP